MKTVLGVCAVLVVSLAGAAAASPAHPRPPAQKVLLRAIARLEAHTRIDAADAARARSSVNRAAVLIRHLPATRSGPLVSVLDQAAAIAGKLTTPRALAVFGQLAENDSWFAEHGPAADGTDITDADGLVYRYFPGKGFELHPLANFAALNADVASKNLAATTRLANALIARGVPQASGGTGWEYYFDYSDGRAPWLSGFSQAVAAQAFARAAKLVPVEKQRFDAAARSAFRAIPGRLVRSTSLGPWIALYSFNRLIVLNAQLQSAISLSDYARAESDPEAAVLASSMEAAAARALPQFDTGYWTYYSLPANPSSLSYQEYVVQLLQRLERTDTRFAAAATRFAAYQSERPAFRLADAGPGAVTFWVSKPATVQISALGGYRRLNVAGGWHTVRWTLPARAGIYPVRIHATDWAGNSAAVSALPIVRVAVPPKPKKSPGKRTVAAATEIHASPLPRLSIGAGIDQPDQAALVLQNGLGTVRMTLAWPAGSSAPDPGAIAALERLPAGAGLVLDLYASPAPVDTAGRAALASYAAAVAAQVPALRDLVLGPAPAGTAAATTYEPALAAVYDAVKAAAPAVRVDGSLDGEQAPKITLTALAAAYLVSSRTTPLMDALAFHPAPGAGADRWALGNLGKLTSALDSGFDGSAQTGGTLPLLIDDVAVESAIPAAEIPIYGTPAVGTTGLDEPSQAAAYVAALKTIACRADVVGLTLHRLVDSTIPGEQSGLYYADGTPKTSLAAVRQAIAAAETETRGCPTAAGTPPPVTTTVTTTVTTPTTTATTTTVATPTPTTTTTSTPTATSPTTTTTTTPTATSPTTTTVEAPTPVTPEPNPVPLATPGALAFPEAVKTTTAPRVLLGCSQACLYLVTLQRAGDGTPVLARRGAARPGARVTVTLPQVRLAPGRYRFAVWLVSQADPGPVSVTRSAVVTTG